MPSIYPIQVMTIGGVMIYAVEVLNFAYVKIGFTESSDLDKRIAQLQTGNPFEIKKVFMIDGTLRQEKTLHALLGCAFSSTGIKCPPNEWYVGRAPMFKGFLENLKHGFDFGVAYLAKFDQANYSGCGYQKIERMDAYSGHEWGKTTRAEIGHIPFDGNGDHYTKAEKAKLLR